MTTSPSPNNNGAQAEIRIWLDELRPAPEGYICCRSVNEAKRLIRSLSSDSKVAVIDCDHDLGDYAFDGGDGIRLLDWLAENERFYPIVLHTMNPVGRENMRRLIQRYWK